MSQRRRTRILYLEHASAKGGSAVSLRYTVEGIDHERFEPIIALTRPTNSICDYHKDTPAELIEWPGIGVWNHSTAIARPMQSPSTWVDLSRVARSWKRTRERTLQLVARVKPDVVHLNSVVLSPSAHALHGARIPFVWHVREHPPHESVPWRTRLVGQMLGRWPNERIFISEGDRQAWTGGRTGRVVHDFVDFKRFDRRIDGSPVRQELGISQNAPTVLFVGGYSELKGASHLLHALALVRNRVPDVRCIAPGSIYSQEAGPLLKAARTILPLVGSGTYVQRMDQLVARERLETVLVKQPFRTDVERLCAAADVLVFPATAPHFARPIVEAAAMGKPSIASDLPGAQEIIIRDKTGLLVPARDPTSLAEALVSLLLDPEVAKTMGEAAYKSAKARFSAETNCQAIMDVYDRLIG